MKRMILLSLFCLAGIVMANAQRFALIDMEYIMENIPEYQQANNELELASQQYQKAIEAKAKEAETLYLAYQKASSTLSAAQRTQKEEAIVSKERPSAPFLSKNFFCISVLALLITYFAPSSFNKEVISKED